MSRKVLIEPDITEFLNLRLVKIVKSLPRVFSFLVIVIGVLDLIGWEFDLTALKSVSSEFVSMTPNSALCLIFSAVALLLLVPGSRTSPHSRFAKAIGIFILSVGSLTLLQYLTNRNLRVDTFLFSYSIHALVSHGTVRMEPITAINFVFLGLALFLFDLRKERLHPPSHILAFFIAMVATLPLIGYLYQSKFLIGIGAFSAMAPQTAICFLMLSIVIFVGRLDHDLAAVLISDGPAGSMARRLLPAAILIPLLLGGLRVWGEALGLLSYEFGTALFTTVNIAGFAVLIWLQSVAIQKAEAKRRAVENDRNLLNIESEMRDQFVSMLSHDLRTPVTAASAYAQLIKRFPEKNELSKSHAEKIIESMVRIDKMTRNLLDVNRIRAGHPLQLTMSDCDLKTVIRDTISGLTAIHGPRFKFETEGNMQGSWDCAAIQRVVENLCNNAIKYGALDSLVTVRLEHAVERVRLKVHNFGNPIPSDAQKKLFDPFNRAGANEFQKAQGWGIGLAVVRGIAEAHGGKVTVETSGESGTTFTVELPVWNSEFNALSS
jgi:signal transduction histidine kinase